VTSFPPGLGGVACLSTTRRVPRCWRVPRCREQRVRDRRSANAVPAADVFESSASRVKRATACRHDRAHFRSQGDAFVCQSDRQRASPTTKTRNNGLEWLLRLAGDALQSVGRGVAVIGGESGRVAYPRWLDRVGLFFRAGVSSPLVFFIRGPVRFSFERVVARFPSARRLTYRGNSPEPILRSQAGRWFLGRSTSAFTRHLAVLGFGLARTQVRAGFCVAGGHASV